MMMIILQALLLSLNNRLVIVVSLVDLLSILIECGSPSLSGFFVKAT
jgi:hypothetical protein